MESGWNVCVWLVGVVSRRRVWLVGVGGIFGWSLLSVHFLMFSVLVYYYYYYIGNYYNQQLYLMVYAHCID